jgi:template-activating factor I
VPTLDERAARGADRGTERDTQARLQTIYEKRRPVLKAIDKFWPVALRNCAPLAVFGQLGKDQQALAYLEDVWLARSADDWRVFTLEFVSRVLAPLRGHCVDAASNAQHFKPNPFFTDAVLKKEYKFNAPPADANDKPDENGITEAMLEFSWDRDVEPQVRVPCCRAHSRVLRCGAGDQD